MKAVLRGKFIVIQFYLKKIETFQINNLTLRLKELKEQQQRQPRASRRKGITKIRAEVNDIQTERRILRFNKSRRWFFEKISKWQAFKQTQQEKKKTVRTQINTIRKRRDYTQYHRNTKDYKKLLQRTTYQKI